ncbi:MAG: hypothetical protein M3T56_04665 [Chloroflexota bacterium]|nr:hypothetical protein [Chloroflexota bacterium]
MIRVESLVWQCVPTIAACQIIAVSWHIAPPMIAHDLSPNNEFLKTIRVFTVDEDDLLYGVCTMSNRGDTRVELFIADALDSRMVEVAKDFVERVKARAEDEGLTRRPIGFGRR